MAECHSSFESAHSQPESPICQAKMNKNCTAEISIEEFERMQESLIQLRTNGYSLEEDKKRLLTEVEKLRNALKSGQDELNKSINTISRSQNIKTIEFMEEEIDGLRLKLGTQEEEFRLQQSTLMQELNKVIRHSDNIETELKIFKLNDQTENVGLEKQVEQMSHNEDSGKENEALLDKIELYENDIKSILDRERHLKESLSTCKHELQVLNEKYRKKQESYVQLNAEKEGQYEEYKKSLDTVVERKEEEMRSVLAEINRLKRELKAVGSIEEKEMIWDSEREALNQQIISLRADCSELQQINESLQIQLQETHSANDCLSAQVESGKRDVLHMQSERDQAIEMAEKRKGLVTEMNAHMEVEKKELNEKTDEMKKKFATEILQANTEIDILTKRLEGHMDSAVQVRELTRETEHAKSQLEILNTDLIMEKENKKALQLQLHDMRMKHQEEIENFKKKHEDEWKEIKQDSQNTMQELTKKIEELNEMNLKSKQEVKDGKEELNIVEKKQLAMVKDLKRQVNAEKKRAEKLQEKLQETLTEINRSRGASPSSNGFEEIKAELMEVPKRCHTDSGSVSSWTMLGTNSGKNDSNTDKNNDNDSNCSAALLESDNVELMARVAGLQKSKSELEERLALLQESNAGMAQDLINKSIIIEQYVRDKPTAVLYPHSNSPERLPASLKKMLEMVKMDFSAPDIRDTNRSLQIMLEETLIKNLNLQKDLEIMSEEIGRQSTPRPS